MNLTVSDLGFAYDKRPILQGVSFSLGSGQLVALLGCNGAGKTTLLRCILGLGEGYTGSITMDGCEICTLTPRQLARHIAYIPQIHYPAFSYSVLEMVLMGMTHRLSAFGAPCAQDEEAALAALRSLGIGQLSTRSYGKLSGGEQQLVLIARALAQGTKLLLMDEPTASLDYGNGQRVLATVRRLTREGYTVLLSTHDPQHALTYADRILALSGGVLIADGTPRTALTPALIHTLYGVDVEFSPDGKYILSREAP